MQTLLLSMIVLLSCAICALAGFWFYRAPHEARHSHAPPLNARRTDADERWQAAVRASRYKAW